MRPSPALLFAAALALVVPVAAAEPPPIPEKDLTFADGWTFQSRGNNCTATRALNGGVTLTLGFTNFHDGAIRLTGKLPPIDEAKADALNARHGQGAGYVDVGDGNYVDQYDEGVDYGNFPGTAVFVDGEVAARFDYGVTEDGATTYRIGQAQDEIWGKLTRGALLQVKVLGKQIGAMRIDAAAGLWDEMQRCIDQYPDG